MTKRENEKIGIKLTNKILLRRSSGNGDSFNFICSLFAGFLFDDSLF